MKHLLLSSLMACTFFVLSPRHSRAQCIPPSDFETWTNDIDAPLGSMYQKPAGVWKTGNMYASTAFILQGPVDTSTQAYQGQYAARLSTFQSVYSSIPGLLFLGKPEIFDSASIKIYDGIPCQQMPAAVDIYYRYFPTANDSCSFLVRLYKRNNITGQRDTIGSGFFSTTQTINTYTPLHIPINYQSAQAPDSIGIVISSSYGGGKYRAPFGTQSVLYIDNFSLSVPTSFTERNKNQFNLYPNPNQGKFIIKQAGPIPCQFTLMNLAGQELHQGMIRESENEIDLSAWPKGFYIITLKNEKLLSSRKMLIY